MLKPGSEPPKTNIYLPPVMQSTLMYNPKVFNGKSNLIKCFFFMLDLLFYLKKEH